MFTAGTAASLLLAFAVLRQPEATDMQLSCVSKVKDLILWLGKCEKCGSETKSLSLLLYLLLFVPSGSAFFSAELPTAYFDRRRALSSSDS